MQVFGLFEEAGVSGEATVLHHLIQKHLIILFELPNKGPYPLSIPSEVLPPFYHRQSLIRLLLAPSSAVRKHGRPLLLIDWKYFVCSLFVF